jgi:hypothetical protein
MTTTSAEAFQLAKDLQEASSLVSQQRFAQWDKISPKRRQELDDLAWDLLSASSTMLTIAVGRLLDQAEQSVAELNKATAKAKTAIKTINDVKQIIVVATALTGLAAALIAASASGNPAALGPALANLLKAVKPAK